MNIQKIRKKNYLYIMLAGFHRMGQKMIKSSINTQTQMYRPEKKVIFSNYVEYHLINKTCDLYQLINNEVCYVNVQLYLML